MRIIEKFKAFRDATKIALETINADRDLATGLLTNAELIRDKYFLISKLCKNTAEGITKIRDMFSGVREVPDNFDLQKTLRDASTVLGNYFTVVKTDNPETVTFIPTYDAYKGCAYSGISDLFERLAGDIKVHIDLMRTKIKFRNFKGAIRQYVEMTKWVKSRCIDLGLKMPEFSEVNLDKYKNTEENDN